MLKVTQWCLNAVDLWRQPWFLSQGLVLGAPCCRIMLATDTSLTGWGAAMDGHPARGLWSCRHLTRYINCLKMLAVFWALKNFLPVLRDHHVLVCTSGLWYSLTHPVLLGLDAMVQTWLRLRLYDFPLIALLPEVLARVRRDEVSLLLVLVHRSGRAELGSRTWLLSLAAPHGISSHRQGAPSFTPTRSYGSCGCGPWGSIAHSFRSLNQGCWDPPPIQSSFNEETVHIEVETFHFMVRRSPTRPISQPDWYSAGVPAGPTLCKVDPLHLEGLCHFISFHLFK